MTGISHKPFRLFFQHLARGLFVTSALISLPSLANRQVPPEVFFQNAKVSEAVIAPGGHKLAMTAIALGRRELRVIEFVPELKARVVARFGDADIVNVRWVNDDRLVFSITDELIGQGDVSQRAPGLYAVNADGTSLRELVLNRPEATGGSLEGTRIKKVEPLPFNHVLIDVPRIKPKGGEADVVIGRINYNSDLSLQSLTPLWLDTVTGRVKAATFENTPANANTWIFDAEGQARGVHTLQADVHRFFWRTPERNTWELVHESKGVDPSFRAELVDRDGRLWVRAVEDGPGSYSGFTRFDFKANQPELPALVSTPGFDFQGKLVQDEATGRALGVRLHTDTEQTHWFDAAMQTVQEQADKVLPGRVNRLLCGNCDRPDGFVVVKSYSDQDPGRYLLYEKKSQRWSQLSTILDGIDPHQMATVDLQRIKTRDGSEMPVWLTIPKGIKPGTPAPAVVLIHGGPWTRGGYWEWEDLPQFLASRGYLVISPEFRGSTGYGGSWYRAGWKQWGQSMQDDVADALIWAQKKGLAAPKACVAGASYGGYSALMALARNPELFACGISWLAVTDLNLLVNGSWWINDDMSSGARAFVLPELVGHPVHDAAMLKAHSPIHLADKIKAPLLLAMGEADRRVPLAHGNRMRAALTEAGNPPQWVTYPGEGHGWSQAKTRIDFAKKVELFLHQHVPVKQ
jgi:dipeptidyl aminopeptidase/acylaminoacyl peptidase